MAETHFPPGFVPPCNDIINMSWDSDDDADEVSEYLTFRKSNVRERENLYSSMFNAENQKSEKVNKIKKKGESTRSNDKPTMPLRRSARGKENTGKENNTDIAGPSQTPSSRLPLKVLNNKSQMSSLSNPVSPIHPSRSSAGFSGPQFSPRSPVSIEHRETDSETQTHESNTSDSVNLSKETLSYDEIGASINDTSLTRDTTESDTIPEPARNKNSGNSQQIPLVSYGSSNESEEENNTSSVSKSPPKKKRHLAQKKPRLRGQIITSENGLPDLSNKLKRDLKAGIINRQTLNREVKDYIMEKTDDQYLSTDEWNHLCEQLIAEYPILSDADDPKGYKDLKYKLQNSITSERSYKLNGIPSRNKVPTAATSEPSTSRSTDNESLLLELQVHTRDIERIQYLIKQTLQARQVLEPDKRVELYPHYKNGEMLIYEYTLLINQSQDELEERAKGLLQDLALTFNTDQNNLERQMGTLNTVQTELIPKKFKNKNIKPALVCRDASEVYRDVDALSIGHEEQAPFCVTVIDTNQLAERVIAKALLIYKNSVISQLDNPTLPKILVLLLGSYFTLDVGYPIAYNSFLRVLEKQINGSFSKTTNNKGAKKEYFNFMKFTFRQNRD